MILRAARFEGKVVVVTGASGGMGLAAAEMVGSEGAKVVAVARNEEKLVEAKKKITAAGMAPERGDNSSKALAKYKAHQL